MIRNNITIVITSHDGRNVKNCADDDTCRRILLEHEREREGKLRDIAASLTQPRVRRIKLRTSEPTRDVVDAINSHQDKLVRNDRCYPSCIDES